MYMYVNKRVELAQTGNSAIENVCMYVLLLLFCTLEVPLSTEDPEFLLSQSTRRRFPILTKPVSDL